MSDFSFAIITVSDSCHLGQATDESGPAIKSLLQQTYDAIKIMQSTVPDEKDLIEKLLISFSDDAKVNCIFTTGGTGFAQRDVTPEATKNVIHRECPQLALAMALESFKKTQFAALSRAICGIRDKTLIINLPGSKKAVVECFGAIQAVLPHALELITDEKSKIVATHKTVQKDFLFPDPISDFPKPQQMSAASSNQSLDIIASIPKPQVKVEKLFDTSSIADSNSLSSKQSEMSDISEILNKSFTTMDEIFLDDDTLKMPTRRNFVQPAEKPMSITSDTDSDYTPKPKHVCPHKTAKAGDKDDRNSPFPMLDVEDALEKVFLMIKPLSEPEILRSPMNCPPFRASIKDGYAIKSISTTKVRTVIGNISAGDKIVRENFADNECYKINTGAAVPNFADAIIQVEDTVVKGYNPDGSELEIELKLIPVKNCDIRDVGCDLSKGEILFRTNGLMDVPEKTILASVGLEKQQKMPRVAIISTGDELVDPSAGELREGQIYDSNSTMLKLLLQKHGFTAKIVAIAKDDYQSLKGIVQHAMKECDVIISSGGVSMGDKDFVKPLLKDLGFEIQFGRVNMKPGKPMTFASNGEISYFALPGNPVSAYVTFHLFVLPALRFMCGFPRSKCKLPMINVILQNNKYELDSRPEYARASISFSVSKALYYAKMHENQMSSRLSSLINADVLLHLPGGTEKQKFAIKGSKHVASIINPYFISDYQP